MAGNHLASTATITCSSRTERRLSMSEQEQEYLRDLHAGFAMIGLLMKGDKSVLQIPTLAYEIADGMAQARKPSEEGGIVSIKRRYAKGVKSDDKDSNCA